MYAVQFKFAGWVYFKDPIPAQDLLRWFWTPTAKKVVYEVRFIPDGL